MKTLPILLLAALVAFAALPLTTAISLFAAVGLGIVLFADYTRQSRFARLHRTPVALRTPASTLRLAA